MGWPACQGNPLQWEVNLVASLSSYRPLGWAVRWETLGTRLWEVNNHRPAIGQDKTYCSSPGGGKGRLWKICEKYISFTMSDVEFNALLIRVSEKISETELLRLKRLCRGKISTDDGDINSVWDLLLDLEKCKNLGPDKLDVLRDVLNNVKGGTPLLKDVHKFQEIRKGKVNWSYSPKSMSPKNTNTYILLTKRESRTGRISARGLDSTDRAQRGPYKKDRGPIFSQYGREQAWLIRDLLYDFKFKGTQVRDHSGQCPVQYLENIGPAIEHFDWLILVIGPLSAWVV